MRMDAGLDTGPTLARREMDLSRRDTAKTVHDRLAGLGAELIGDTLDALNQRRVHEVPQPSEGVTYAEKVNKTEALIDWQQDAAQVLRRVRAFNPLAHCRDAVQRRAIARFGMPKCARRLSGGRVLRCARPCPGAAPGTVLTATDEGIDVACGRQVLRILRLQLAGRKALAPGEFIQGQRLDGARFAPA